MSKNLVLVESPAKAKTINKYLGKDYVVEATIGHIRNLPKTKLGVDVDDNFKAPYLNIRGKGDVIKKIKSLASKSKNIFIATDPDREGEAIAQDIADVIVGINGLNIHSGDAGPVERRQVVRLLDLAWQVARDVVVLLAVRSCRRAAQAAADVHRIGADQHGGP